MKSGRAAGGVSGANAVGDRSQMPACGVGAFLLVAVQEISGFERFAVAGGQRCRTAYANVRKQSHPSSFRVPETFLPESRMG